MVRKTNNLLTTKEVAEKYNVSRQAIHMWLNDGLPHYQLGPKTFKYDPVAVEEWVLLNRSDKAANKEVAEEIKKEMIRGYMKMINGVND